MIGKCSDQFVLTINVIREEPVHVVVTCGLDDGHDGHHRSTLMAASESKLGGGYIAWSSKAEGESPP